MSKPPRSKCEPREQIDDRSNNCARFSKLRDTPHQLESAMPRRYQACHSRSTSSKYSSVHTQTPNKCCQMQRPRRERRKLTFQVSKCTPRERIWSTEASTVLTSPNCVILHATLNPRCLGVSRHATRKQLFTKRQTTQRSFQAQTARAHMASRSMYCAHFSNLRDTPHQLGSAIPWRHQACHSQSTSKGPNATQRNHLTQYSPQELRTIQCNLTQRETTWSMPLPRWK